ncbi:YrhA family protein [Halalkalibacterium halodurans]|uniref:YrhA family protein n=1 Tax=Halalkalibacterium halodurans TaxID=86665 RepID=UPI002E1B9744|nr:YrhA family protein [Halalkalibacterium halodurans]
MPKWKDLLMEIEKIEKKYGDSLRNPASDTEIQKMNLNIRQQLGNIALPTSYIDFLKKVNGLDFNGLVIYGVDKVLLDKEVEEDIHGFIETNEIWYKNEWQEQYVFLGDSDIALYCYDLKERIYVELDKPSGTLMQSFENFDSMLNDALETTLLS